MPRLSLAGLLFNNLDDIYQQSVEAVFQQSGKTREAFALILDQKIDEVSEIFDKRMVEEYRKHFTLNFKKYNRNILEVEKSIAKNYELPFRYYFSYLGTCHTVVKHLLEQITQYPHNETDTVLASLYAHLLRVADQIGILLLNGYTDGALILWRTFYEFALTTKLLANQDDETLSRKFMQHNIRHVKKMAESYNTRLVSEGFEAVEPQGTQHIHQEHEKLSSQYGSEFVDKDFGWAYTIPELKNNPNIRTIEDMLQMGRYRPYYIYASAHSHPNFEVFKEVTVDNKIMVGQIKEIDLDMESLVDPMQFTLAVLEDIHISFIPLISDDAETDLNLELFSEMYMQLIRLFQKEENNK